MRQCIIYDSNKADAKLIGIEYIISRKLFDTLPAEERKYWHSHEYEVRQSCLMPHREMVNKPPEWYLP